MKDHGNVVAVMVEEDNGTGWQERQWECGGGGRKDIGNLVVLTDAVVVAVEERQWKCGGGNGGGTTTEMWRWWKRKDNGNLVVLTDERQRKCGAGGRKKTMEIWWF